MAYRSLIFAPGNHPRKVEKVFGLGADGVILDLEDAVAVAEKVATRERVAEALGRERSTRAFVRVNDAGTEFCYGDLVAVVGPRLDGVILPKVESPETLVTIDWLLRQLEREHGMEPGRVDLVPILETGAGLSAIDAIARSGTRVRRLAFGAGDYTLDMNLAWSRDESEIHDARMRVTLASRAAGLEPPLDTVYIEIRDHEGFAASCALGKRLGFQGKMCIHPDQVGAANAAFSPTPGEIERAERIVAAFEAAEATGSASIQIDGYFVDYPIVEKARRTVELARSIGA